MGKYISKWIGCLFLLCLIITLLQYNHMEQATSHSITQEQRPKHDLQTPTQFKIQHHPYPTLAETVHQKEGKRIVTNPDSIQVVVNKDRSLPADYQPTDLVIPDVPFAFSEDLPKKYLRKEAAEHLEHLFKDAKKEGLNLVAQSGYRSYQRQETIFATNMIKNGKKHTDRTNAHPGQSEHQTGLAMDVTCSSINFGLLREFAHTPEGKWLKENAYKYGFVIRYPQGKEKITGYQYEPWHLRYIGKDVAEQIHLRNLTVEEFFQESQN